MPNEGGTAPGSQCPQVHEVWQQASITVSLDIEIASVHKVSDFSMLQNSYCYWLIDIPRDLQFFHDSLPLSTHLSLHNIVNPSSTATLSQSYYTMSAQDDFHLFIDNEAEVSRGGYESDEDEDEDEDEELSE